MKRLFLLLPIFAFCATACNKTASPASIEKIQAADSLTTEQAEPAKTNNAEDLKPYFKHENTNTKSLVQPKSVAANGNGVYCYFQFNRNKASGFRMRIQYWDEKYADADQYRFDVDGKTYEYLANRSKSGSSNSQVIKNASFYWFDNRINKTDEAFLRALSTASKVTIDLIDRATNSSLTSITLSDLNKKDIGRTLNYYFALNGATIAKEGMVNIRE